MNINSGYELGDHGFYLLHILHPFDIDYTLTHFGLVWNLFFGQHGIVSNRILNIVLLNASAFALALAIKFVLKDKIGLVYVLIGTFVAIVSYFASFIIDPSYNSLSLAFSIFGIAAVTMILHAEIDRIPYICAAMSIILGFLIAALVIIKASSAVALTLFAAGCFIAVSVKLKKYLLFINIGVLSIIGGIFFAIVFHLTTGAVGHVIESFKNGLDVYSYGKTHSLSLMAHGVIERIYWYLRASAGAVFLVGWIIAVPVLVVMAILIVLGGGRIRRNALSIYSRQILGIIYLIPIATAYILYTETGRSMIQAAMITLFNLNILLTLWILFKPGFKMNTVVIILGLVCIPLVAIFGTQNAYYSQILFIGIGHSFPAAYVAAITSTDRERNYIVSVVTMIGISIVLMVGYHMIKYPYRMAGGLQDATILTDFGNNQALNTTQSISSFVEEIRMAAYDGPPEIRPTVFDLSGQLPIAVVLLNGRPPGAAWLLDAFGERFSQTIFSEMDDSKILEGWILARSTDLENGGNRSPHFNSFIGRLEHMGVTFDEQFIPILTVEAPSWGAEGDKITVVLFRPRKVE
ncbi:hypothetical protein [Minwuia thermotolerans]|uniref:hypothetical protein n=1 Tax=Minwuia thermotolerans TaxID=2056226 RepID=UPI000F63706A|nr:hypothetical protein [Minwuia thermotolerans]